MSGGAPVLQGRVLVRTAPTSPIPPTVPALGSALLRVGRLRHERHRKEISIRGRTERIWTHASSVFTVTANIESWAGDAWHSAPARALLDGLDTFHTISANGLLILLQVGNVFRAAVVELPIPSQPAGDDIEVVRLDFAPAELRVISSNVDVHAVITADGQYLEPATALTRQSTAAGPYRIGPADAKSLSATLLARAVSSAWRTEGTPANLEYALPLLRHTFKRYLLTFAQQRLLASRDLVSRERTHWISDTGWAPRLVELKDLLSIAQAQFGDLYKGLDELRRALLPIPMEAGTYPPIDIDAEELQERERIEQALQRSRTSLDLARVRFLIHTSRNARGAVGLIPREDVFDDDTERDPDDIRDLAIERLDGLLAMADARLADIHRERNYFHTEHCDFYQELLATQPITDVALQLGFGMEVLFTDAMTQQEHWQPWAEMSSAAQLAMRQDLLVELIGEPASMLDRELMLLGASLLIIIPAAIVGFITGQVWIPLLASALALGIDIIDLYLKLDRIAERGTVVHAVHGLPGYRDPELVRDFWMTAAFTVFSVILDVVDVARIAIRLRGVVALDQRFSLIPGLRRAMRELSERSRVGFDEVAAAARADAIQAANAGLRFADDTAANTFAGGLLTKLSDPNTFGAGKADFLAQIDARGGWVAVETALTQMGANAAKSQLHAARQILIDTAIAGHAVDSSAGLVRALTMTASGDLDSKISALRALRNSLKSNIGPGWSHQLGLTAHLVLTTAADKAAAVQKLRNAWPSNWVGAQPPAHIDNVLANFAELLSEGFGGWAALGKQLDNALPEVAELRKLRDTRLYPYLEATFNVRKGGTESIASDLDVSVMFEVGADGIKKRMSDMRDFLVRATGLSDPHAWRNAFDMELFVDPSLATFYDRLPRNGSAFVLAQYVFKRAAALTDLMRLGDDGPLLGFDLLAQYARKNPFPDDVLAARFAANGAARSARDTETALLSKLDDALAEYDTTLASLNMGMASKADLLDSSRRVSDVALAVAMNNDEAYFLAGATKTVMSIRDGSNLYKGLNVSLSRLQRLHIEELHHTLDENWFAHVAHAVGRVRTANAAEFAALELAQQEARLAQAFFQLGKYGQMRAVGFVVNYGAKLGFDPALVTRATQLAQRGEILKAMRNSADPLDILRALGKLTTDETELLDVHRLLRDNPQWAGDLGAQDKAILATGSLSRASAVARARAALDEELAVLVGTALDFNPSSGVFAAGSLLGDLQTALRTAQETPLLQMNDWLAAKLAPKLGPYLANIGDPSLVPDPAEPTVPDRELGVTPPTQTASVLDPADLDHLWLEPVWQAPQ